MGQWMCKLGGALLAAVLFLTGCQSLCGQELDVPLGQALLPEAPTEGGAAGMERLPTGRQPSGNVPTSAPLGTTVPASQPPETTAPFAPPGLALCCRTLPDGLRVQGDECHADGSRIQRYGYDGVVTLSLERRPRVETGEAAFRTALLRWEARPREVRLDPDPAASQALGYPAWRAAYVTGEGSAAQVHLDLIIQAPAWTFRLHTASPPEAQQMYEADIEAWIGGLRLTETDGGASAPF